jgi:hypothetical protein
VHFIREDCRTSLGKRNRRINFATEEGFLAFVARCHPEPPDDEDECDQSFEDQYEACGQGSVFVQLTDEQYARLAK